MPRSPLSLRERRLALMAAVVIGSWVAVSWLVEPLWHRVQYLEQRVSFQTLKLEKLSDLLAKRSSIDRAYQAISVYLSVEKDDKAPATFLGELEALAQRANVQIDLKPRPVKRRGGVSRVSVELNLQATQERLFSFLDALLSMPRLIEVVRLHLATAPRQQDMLRAHLIIEKVTLHR